MQVQEQVQVLVEVQKQMHNALAHTDAGAVTKAGKCEGAGARASEDVGAAAGTGEQIRFQIETRLQNLMQVQAQVQVMQKSEYGFAIRFRLCNVYTRGVDSSGHEQNN